MSPELRILIDADACPVKDEVYRVAFRREVAVRAIMADLRSGGDAIGGPAPFTKADRSRFLQALDEALVRLAR